MSTAVESNLALSDREFERIRALVQSELGLSVAENKRAMIQSRLARRFRALGFNDARTYCAYLFGEGKAAGETSHLLDVVTTNFTFFYREPPQLDMFRSEIMPELARDANAKARPIQLWSAAASTGEEPWTLAMILDAHGSRGALREEPHVFGSDVSGRVLETAKLAIYSQEQAERLPEDWRDRYLMRGREAGDKRVRIVPQLRSRVSFQRLNLMAAHYDVPGGLDAIFLRNVLIYFDRPTQRAVVARAASHLRPGGYLMLGASESLNGFELPLRYLTRSMYRKDP